MDTIVSIMKALSIYQPDRALLKAIAKELKTIRQKKNLTIEELSDICGLHEKYLQTIERNHRNISVSVFVQIAKALNISPSKLLEKAVRSK
jgi:transcriptional regulator with XRE-family HTH domain